MQAQCVDFRREVTIWLDRGSKRYIRVDFMIEAENRMVIIEVDEHQHALYDRVKERERQEQLLETISGKVHLIRFNPNSFSVDGVPQRASHNERHRALLAAVLEDIADTKVTYLFYDVNEPSPSEPALAQYFQNQATSQRIL